jgi:alpha-glucan,water dikinase
MALTVTASGDVTATAGRAPAPGSTGNGNGAAAAVETKKPIKLAEPYFTANWAMPEPEFTSRLVGAKGWNLAQMRRNLPDWIKVPASMALPFRTFERVLADPSNQAAALQLAQFKREIAAAAQQDAVPPQLAQARELVASQLLPPLDLIMVRLHQGLGCIWVVF